MNKITVPTSLPTLVKPTQDTPFHIDYGWWDKQNLHLNVELRGHLCPEHQQAFSGHFDTEQIDWVDERTGEVTQVDGLQHVLQIHCSKQPGYINEALSLVDAVFRMFLTNGNNPLTPNELGNMLGRSPEKILSTLGGRRVYKGIRPVRE
jgi:hypothetical protein